MAVSTIDPNGLNVGQFGNRNMVTNGSMAVAQRGNVAVNQSAVVYGGADRWRMYPNISGTASSTVAQTAVTWTESKFAQGLTATTASAAGSMLFMQRIEAVNTSHIAGNKVTLQFKIAHDVGSTLTVQIVLQRPTNTADDYSSTTDISGVTTVGTCPTGTSSGTLFTYTSDTLTSTDVSKGLQIQIRVVTTAAVTNKNFYLGDVQLELGDTATPFEHISFGDQLQKCMRYTFIYEPQYYQAFPIFGAGSNTAKWFPTFPVKMRTKPTLITKDVLSTIQGFNYVSGSAIAFQSFTLSEGGDLASNIIVTFDNTNNGIANGVFGHWRWISTPTGSYVGFDAEL